LETLTLTKIDGVVSCGALEELGSHALHIDTLKIFKLF